MSHMIEVLPDLEYPIVVTAVALPNPQNYAPSVVTGQPDRDDVLSFLRTAQLSVVAEMSKSIADLFCNYFRGCSNSSFAITHTSVQLPPQCEVPARKTPFGRLNFLASPAEGLYFDPDDIVES